jgi:phosphatidylglycerophosphate synthase
VRRHRSVLAAGEKRLLVWMAERLPRRIHSDHLSALGLLAMAGVGAAFWASRWAPGAALPMVPVLLLVNWFGDSLDGTLARVRRQERPRYGYYVDHVIDMVGTLCLVAGLAASGAMSGPVAAAVLIAFFMVSAESYLATYARGIFNMSFLGFGPTELRLLIAAGAIKLLDGPWVEPFGLPALKLFDIGGAAAAAGLTMTFGVMAARNGVALYREETVRR